MAETIVLPCPKCEQKLRVPIDRGVLTLTCPKCRHRWDWEPPINQGGGCRGAKRTPPQGRETRRDPVRRMMGSRRRVRTGQVVPGVAIVVIVFVYFFSRPPIAVERAIEDRFSKVLPKSRQAVSAWFGQKGLRVLPQARGEDEGELKKVGPIVATRVTGALGVAWPSRRFADGGDGVLLSHLTPRDDSDLVKAGVVAFDKGTVRIDAARFPADGKWHLFCLSAEDPLGTSEDEREVFCLQKASEKDAGSASFTPADLVVQGCIAEGWTGALKSKWSDDQLRCLIFMACGQTELLAREAQGAIGNSLRDKRHAFLVRDLLAAAASLDARKQALLQRLASAP